MANSLKGSDGVLSDLLILNIGSCWAVRQYLVSRQLQYMVSLTRTQEIKEDLEV